MEFGGCYINYMKIFYSDVSDNVHVFYTV
jgi:hypothetical protein